MLRKYLYEYIIITLTGCVSFLFVQYSSLNTFIRDKDQLDRTEMIRVITHNSDVIESFIDTQNKKQ